MTEELKPLDPALAALVDTLVEIAVEDYLRELELPEVTQP
jgi:hypothetical protein